MFAETHLASLVSVVRIEHCFCFSWSSLSRSLNSFFDRPRQEDFSVSFDSVVIRSDFATLQFFFLFFSPFVHFTEPYLWFLAPGCRPGLKKRACSTSLLGQVWISN